MQKKTAQSRKVRNHARRFVNDLGGALAKKAPFRKAISDMDRIDKKVRKEAENLNYFLGMARSFYRRKNYLASASYLGNFHEKARQIHFDLNQFQFSIPEAEQRAFILKKLKGKEKANFTSYDPNKDLGKIDDGLVATAGIVKKVKDWWNVPGRFKDLLTNLTDEDSRELGEMEKNFSVPFYQQLISETGETLEATQVFYDQLLEHFSNMGSAWSRRDVGSYVAEIQGTKVKEEEDPKKPKTESIYKDGFNSSYETYNKKYMPYYNDTVVPWKEALEKINEGKSAKNKVGPAERPTLEMPEVPSLHSQELTVGPPSPAGLRPDLDPPTTDTNTPSSGVRQSQPQSDIDPVTRKLSPSENVDSGPVTKRAPEFSLAPVRRPPPGPAVVQHTKNKINTQRHPNIVNRDVNRSLIKNPSKIDTQRFPALINEHPDSAPFSFNGRPGHVPQDVSDVVEYELTKRKVKSHEEFLGRIEKLSTDQEIIQEILTYSEEVEKYSEEESLKLLAVAEGLIEKQAAGEKAKPKAKTKTKAPEKTPEPEIKSFVPKSDPDTEVSPGTQRSGPSEAGPGTRRMPENVGDKPQSFQSPKSLEGPRDIFNEVYHDQFKPVEHNIPYGNVGKRWWEIPFLKNKPINEIKISPNTADIIWKLLAKKFDAYHIPYDDDKNFREKVTEALKNSLSYSKVETNMQCSGSRDCEIQVFSFIQLDKIDSDPSMEGQIITYTITLRITRFDGNVVIRKITNPKFHSGPSNGSK